jgi:hypothetical protein
MSLSKRQLAQHLLEHRRATGMTPTKQIEKLVEMIFEEGIGDTILGSFPVASQPPLHNAKVKPIHHFVGTSKTGSLSPSLSVDDIQSRLGKRIKCDTDSGDGKVRYYWLFEVNGSIAAIWDYYGTRWSTYGPRSAFEDLGLGALWSRN